MRLDQEITTRTVLAGVILGYRVHLVDCRNRSGTGLAPVFAARGEAMAYRARVYLQRLPDSKLEYLGEINLELRPVRWGRTSFNHKGRREGGYIDSLEPPAWESLGVAPTVLVVQEQGPRSEKLSQWPWPGGPLGRLGRRA